MSSSDAPARTTKLAGAPPPVLPPSPVETMKAERARSEGIFDLRRMQFAMGNGEQGEKRMPYYRLCISQDPCPARAVTPSSLSRDPLHRSLICRSLTPNRDYPEGKVHDGTRARSALQGRRHPRPYQGPDPRAHHGQVVSDGRPVSLRSTRFLALSLTHRGPE